MADKDLGLLGQRQGIAPGADGHNADCLERTCCRQICVDRKVSSGGEGPEGRVRRQLCAVAVVR